MNDVQKPLILIVDRDLASLSSLDFILSRENYRVTTCSTSAEALKAVAVQGLDIVIVGRAGGERNGGVLVTKIKSLSPRTSVLLLVDSSDDAAITDAIAAGVDGIVRRSYTPSQVIKRVERLLEAVHP